MAQLVRKSLDTPDEVRTFPGGTGMLEIVTDGPASVGRATFRPGWRWSEHVKPVVGTDSCAVAHLGYVISGQLKVVMDDGEEGTFGPGDVMACPPGHDAWTLGDAPCVMIDWQGATNDATPGDVTS